MLALWIWGGIAAMPCMALAASSSSSATLEQIYERAWKRASRVDYVVPEAEELAATERLFARLMRGQQRSSTIAELRERGWSVHTQRMGEATWTIVSEAADQRSGRGLYAISDRGRHALQAPHVPSDARTGEILLAYAADTGGASPRALAWNTVHRKNADLARLPDTYLVAFSRAFARVFPDERILQLHGFDASKRRSAAGAYSSAIVSSGHAYPSSALKSSVKCMQQGIEKRTRLYGVDVSELGATRNPVAHALEADGYHGFVHVELDPKMRKRLATDAAQRKKLLACLGGDL
ncbi:MAG TPA: hypothetical protein VIG66_10255 [Noviherbaspirillum sp.]